jgi:hypothetical protein
MPPLLILRVSLNYLLEACAKSIQFGRQTPKSLSTASALFNMLLFQ